MSNTNTQVSSNNNAVQKALNLHSQSLEQLRAEAARLGVVLKDSEDKAMVVQQIIEASTETGTAKAGQLISLHTRNPEAKSLVIGARNVIAQNEGAGKSFSLFLQNKKGDYYVSKVPGCRVTEERLPQVLELLTPLDSQKGLVEDFKANPETFEEPLLVRVSRRNQDGSYSTYVMLYIKPKVTNATEQTF